MNGIQKRKEQNIEKLPGCLGRMVNLFDLNTATSENRLLADKPRRDGSSISRSQYDVVRMWNPSSGAQIEDKIVSERNLSNIKANGKPMKMLIAQEMSKELESNHNPPNVVAKLMGLDALPRQQHNLSVQRRHSKASSRHPSSHSEIPVESWERYRGFSDNVNCCQELNQYKDAYEISQQSPWTTYTRDSSPQKGRYTDNVNENKMALVLQKFMEAKHLVTDEKLRQTKEFQDALEVLSSNRDLFLKFLEEPNSTFSRHLCNLQSLPLPRETEPISVLRPSKMVKIQDIKTIASPSPSAHSILDGEDFYEESEDDDAQEFREAARETTRQMRENLMGHMREETVLSSVFYNGYNGDDSSFNRSENEYAVENLRDSNVMPPTSRHSGDYMDRFGSSYSSSSFSGASCSPESSICREAKKRLSERWAMMASNGSSQEQRHVRRSSSTLGEMLALSDTRNPVRSEEEGSDKEQEARGTTSCGTNTLNKEESTSDEVSDPEAGKEQVSKEVTKAKSMKSTLMGKVSSLFFSKNKKTNKEKSCGAQSADESPSATSGTPASTVNLPQKSSNIVSQCVNDSGIQDSLSPVLGGSSVTASPDLTSMGQKQSITSMEGGHPVTKPSIPVQISENQNQRSPISVLEPPFEEDENTIPESSGGIKPVSQGFLVSPKSNLIDKSPPIESISRALSWDDSCSEMATLYPTKNSSVSPGAKEDQQDWVFSIESLLSTAGFNGEVQFESFIARWHSLESPLDPSLREKYTNGNDKRRQWRSNRKLVLDSVNEAELLEITCYKSDSCMRALLVDHLWAQMKEWFSSEVKCCAGDDGDSNNLVVERVVQKEVLGKGWADNMELEIDNLVREIQGKLLEELVQEAVVDFTAKVF